MLHISDLSYAIGCRPVLRSVNLSLERGEIGVIYGPSGAGKSTLLNVITGIRDGYYGTIRIAGRLHSLGQKSLTYMMQDDLLLSWRTLLQNVALAGELTGRDVEGEARSLLEQMGLGDALDLYPGQLSGGMRQRVALARALMFGRPLLLLDEPFGALDAGTRRHLFALLNERRERFDLTILLITHDEADGEALADRIFLMEEGRIRCGVS